jgi:hypothetical protein
MPTPAGAPMHESFATVTAPRVDRTKLPLLLDMLVMAIGAVICGADTWVEMEADGRAKEQGLRPFLPLPKGIPWHDPFARGSARLQPEEGQPCFLRWRQAVSEVTQGEVGASDGKPRRRSVERATGKSAIDLVSAWARANRLVLGQQTVAAKSNAIPTMPAWLRL